MFVFSLLICSLMQTNRLSLTVDFYSSVTEENFPHTRICVGIGTSPIPVGVSTCEQTFELKSKKLRHRSALAASPLPSVLLPDFHVCSAQSSLTERENKGSNEPKHWSFPFNADL